MADRKSSKARKSPRTDFPTLPSSHPLFTSGWIVGGRFCVRPSPGRPSPGTTGGTPDPAPRGNGESEASQLAEMNTPEFDAKAKKALEDVVRSKIKSD